VQRVLAGDREVVKQAAEEPQGRPTTVQPSQ
jgi:hypothetical protein